MSDGNAEGLFATQPSSPFQWGGISVTASQTEKAVYLLTPAGALAGVADPSGDGVLLPWMRPQLMADALQSVTVLGSGPHAGPKTFSFSTSVCVVFSLCTCLRIIGACLSLSSTMRAYFCFCR